MTPTVRRPHPNGAPLHPTQATELLRTIPFVDRTGIRVDEVGTGRCVLSMDPGPNINHFGTVYAGAIYTLGEVPGAVLFFSAFDAERFFPLVKSSQIRYVAPARGRLWVEATISADEVARLRTEADEHGKADWELQLDITDEDGTVVAEMTSRYQMRTHGSLA